MSIRNLDIERLHRCVEKINAGKPLARGEGATTGMLELVYGDILLGDYDNQYVYVSDTAVSAGIAAWQLSELLDTAGLPISYATQSLIRLSWGMSITFMGADRFCDTRSMCGLKIARVFVDVSLARQMAFDNDCRFIEALLMVKCRGGDVV